MDKIKLKDIADVLNGFSFKSNLYSNSGYRVLRITNVQKGEIIDSSPVFYNDNKLNLFKNSILKEGDILISLTGNVGRVGLLKKELLPAALNQRVGCIRIKAKDVLNKYLFYYLNSNIFEYSCINNSSGVAQKNLSTEWLKNQNIPKYDIKNQQKIVKELDLLNEAIEKQKEQLKEYDNLVKSQFIEMFGDPVLNNLMWETSVLKNIGYLSRGKSSHRPRNDIKLLNGPYPLIQTGDISNAKGLYITTYNSTYSEFGLKQSKLWKKGTICITIAANIGDVGILNFDSCFPDSVVGYIPNYQKAVPEFIVIWFKLIKKHIESKATQVAQKNINVEILNSIKVILPPLPLQNQFAEFVEHIDKLKFSVEEQLKETQNLLNSRMQKYFG